MKNPNGFGGIQKLSGRRRKPYQALVTVKWEYDEVTHKARQIKRTIGTYATRQEAMTALVHYAENPFDIDTANITLEEVYAKWSAEHYPTVSESNVKGCQAAFKLLEPIKKKRMVDIKLDDLQFIADNSGKNSPTLRKYKVLLSQLYTYAIIHDIVPPTNNKVKYIDISKAGNPNGYTRTPFTKDEIDLLWKYADETKNVYCNVILMMIYSGVRISEMIDLKKTDVHLAEKCLDVTEFNSGHKTPSGIRKVPISDKVLPFFRYWMEQEGCEYLLCTPNGGRLTDFNFRNSYWRQIMDALNLKHKPHDTRHTTVSLLAEAGVDDRMIKKIVGHKGQGVTEIVYTHFEIEALLDAINKI